MTYAATGGDESDDIKALKVAATPRQGVQPRDAANSSPKKDERSHRDASKDSNASKDGELRRNSNFGSRLAGEEVGQVSLLPSLWRRPLEKGVALLLRLLVCNGESERRCVHTWQPCDRCRRAYIRPSLMQSK